MILSIVLDFMLIGILIGSIIIGLRDGFIEAIVKPMRPVFSLGFALVFANDFAAMVIAPIAKKPIYNWVSGILYDSFVNLPPESTADELPVFAKLLASFCRVDLSDFSLGEEAVITDLVAKLSIPTVKLIIFAIAFVLLLLVSTLALAIVLTILNNILEAGVLKVVNRVIGCVACAFFAVFTARSMISVFDYAIALPQLAETNAVKNFTGGFIYNLFKQYTPVELLLNF